MFSCQPLHTHLRYSRDGYSVARRVVFALACGLLLIYGAREAVVPLDVERPAAVQSTMLWMSADDAGVLFDAAPTSFPASPVLKPASTVERGWTARSPRANRCHRAPLMLPRTPNCTTFDLRN